MDDALDGRPRGACGSEDARNALHGGADELVWVVGEGVCGRGVVDDPGNALDRFVERAVLGYGRKVSGTSQEAGGRTNRSQVFDNHKLETVVRPREYRLEDVGLVRGAHRRADGEAVLKQVLDYPPADEPVRAGDEDLS